MKHPIDLPNGDLIAGELLKGVSFFPGSGLALKGHDAASLGFLKTVDEEEGRHWRAEIIKIMKGIHGKRPYSYNFDMPTKAVEKAPEQGRHNK